MGEPNFLKVGLFPLSSLTAILVIYIANFSNRFWKLLLMRKEKNNISSLIATFSTKALKQPSALHILSYIIPILSKFLFLSPGPHCYNNISFDLLGKKNSLKHFLKYMKAFRFPDTDNFLHKVHTWWHLIKPTYARQKKRHHGPSYSTDHRCQFNALGDTTQGSSDYALKRWHKNIKKRAFLQLK